MPQPWRRRPDGPAWLYAEPGRLRAVWRLLLFGAAIVLAGGIAESFVGPLLRLVSQGIREPVAAYPWTMLVGVWAATVLALRVVDDAEWSAVGLGEGAWRWRQLGRGVCLGTAAIGVVAVLLLVPGWLAFERVGSPLGSTDNGVQAWVGAAVRTFALLAPAALWEELLFRGYLWRVAADAGGGDAQPERSGRLALWSTSVAFGLVHLENLGGGVRTTLVVALAGLCLGLLRWRSGSLPAAWAAHLAWNWTMAAVLHVPVSGLPFGTPGYRAVPSGPAWVTGGAWGPEGGVVAALVLSGALLYAGPYAGLYARRMQTDQTTNQRIDG